MSEGTREHPAVEVWRDYRAKRLPEEREEALREHLVACDWCQELVLGLARAEQEGGQVASLETASDWRRLRGRLVEEGVLPVVAKRKGLPMWVGWAAAACFAALLITLGDDWRLRWELAEPDVNSAIEPVQGGPTRSGGEVETLHGRRALQPLSNLGARLRPRRDDPAHRAPGPDVPG